MKKKIFNWFIRNLGLKGSWKWAKKQMMKGKIVRCKHWSGSLKLAIDDPKNTRIVNTFENDKNNVVWETSTHFLSYEDFTDYEIFEW
jgi:hypothetical protein